MYLKTDLSTNGRTLRIWDIRVMTDRIRNVVTLEFI